jgi:hypothetical protein
MAVALTHIVNASDLTDQTIYTHSMNLGSGGVYAHIILGIHGRSFSGAEGTIVSVTVDGNSAVRLHRHAASNNTVELWAVAYSAGGTVNVVVTWDIQQVREGVVAWGGNGIGSLTPHATTEDITDPVQNAIDCPADGAIVIIAANRVATTGVAVGTGITEDADFQLVDTATNTVWGGHGNFSASQSALVVGCNFAVNGTDPVMCAASLAPPAAVGGARAYGFISG